MAAGRITRRQMLGLLAAGFLTACTSTRHEGGAALPTSTSTSTSTSTTTTTVPHPVGDPTFDTVHPMSGFVAFGDFGGGPAQGAVAGNILQWVRDGHRVDAIVTTGDNVYQVGSPSLFEAYLVDPYRALQTGGQRPMWATLGNHDVVAGHGAQQLAFLHLPPLPFVKTLPGVRFLFLDANQPDDAQARWLADQLADPAPPLFTVAVFHQPVFSCGPHGRTAGVIAHWYPLLDSGKVSLVLNGHDHDYQRFLSAEGTTFIVTGGGGQTLYPLIPGCSAPEMRVGVVKNHFTGVEVYSDRMALTAIATDGKIIDRVDIPATLPTP
jgi:hypothetical protein